MWLAALLIPGSNLIRIPAEPLCCLPYLAVLLYYTAIYELHQVRIDDTLFSKDNTGGQYNVSVAVSHYLSGLYQFGAA